MDLRTDLWTDWPKKCRLVFADTRVIITQCWLSDDHLQWWFWNLVIMQIRIILRPTLTTNLTSIQATYSSWAHTRMRQRIDLSCCVLLAIGEQINVTTLNKLLNHECYKLLECVWKWLWCCLPNYDCVVFSLSTSSCRCCWLPHPSHFLVTIGSKHCEVTLHHCMCLTSYHSPEGKF